jgi:hypothetical protein
VDVDAVCCLSGIALRSAPSIGNFSSAIVRRAVSVFSVPCPTPCCPWSVKSSRADGSHIYSWHGVRFVCLKVCDGENLSMNV